VIINVSLFSTRITRIRLLDKLAIGGVEVDRDSNPMIPAMNESLYSQRQPGIQLEKGNWIEDNNYSPATPQLGPSNNNILSQPTSTTRTMPS
jgi:hypothetical protein